MGRGGGGGAGEIKGESAKAGEGEEAPITKGRKRLSLSLSRERERERQGGGKERHRERQARGDETGRRGRLTRLMSSPSLPSLPVVARPIQRLCHAPSLLTRPRFLLEPPCRSSPSSDYCFVAPMAVPLCVSSTLFFFFPTQVLRFTTVWLPTPLHPAPLFLSASLPPARATLRNCEAVDRASLFALFVNIILSFFGFVRIGEGSKNYEKDFLTYVYNNFLLVIVFTTVVISFYICH